MTNHSLFDLPIDTSSIIDEHLSFYDLVRLGSVSKTWWQFVRGRVQRHSYMPWIAERLSFIDLIRLGAVSKTWRKIVRGTIQRRSYMPWQFTYETPWYLRRGMIQFTSEVEIYDLLSNQSYSMEKFTGKEEVRKLFFMARLHKLKYGWLLFSQESGNKNPPTIRHAFFFYNPFGEKIIEVDPLDLVHFDMARYRVSKVTFTAPPTSPNCVMFVLLREVYEGPNGPETQVIYTYNLGDRRWNILYKTQIHSEKYVWDVAYMDEILYCVFYSEEDSLVELGTIRWSSSSSSSSCVPLDQDWVMVDFKASLRLETLGGCKGRLVEHDGKLLLAIYYVKQDYWQIYQFHSSKKDWTMIKSLENQVLFLGFSKKGASYVGPAKGKATEFANMILCPHRHHIQGYYSYTCKTQGNWSFHRSYRRGNHKRKEYRGKFNWIQPPVIN